MNIQYVSVKKVGFRHVAKDNFLGNLIWKHRIEPFSFPFGRIFMLHLTMDKTSKMEDFVKLFPDLIYQIKELITGPGPYNVK